MSDRELLEAASRAAGSSAKWYAGFGMGIDNGGPVPTPWNPLTDDGDALRLAVQLCIDIKPPRSEDDSAQARQVEQSEGVYESQREADPYAATRRAILRAAAAMAPKEPTCP